MLPSVRRVPGNATPSERSDELEAEVRDDRTVIVHKTGCGTWILVFLVLILNFAFLGPCSIPACLIAL